MTPSPWPHFSVEELDCPCCHRTGMNHDFMDIIESFRGKLVFPFRISSGYRCAAHNKAVGGVDNSPHTLGRAVDILVAFDESSKLVTLAARSGLITGIGIRQHGPPSGRYVHLDDFHEKLTFWSYP